MVDTLSEQSQTRAAAMTGARQHASIFDNRRLLALFFLGLLAGGVALRAATVWRPIDYTSTSPWRECDLGMIARNFWRDGMNILHPRIDWRGDGPGDVESELPLLAWLMAAGYRLFGYHEEIGRVLALLTSLATLWAFFRLARALLPPFEARAATVFFSFHPLMIQLATNIQPDPGMLLCCILCVHAFVRWRRGGRDRDLFWCALAGALAILLKAPAACLGLLIAALCCERFGWRAVARPRLWLLTAAMLLPAALWYAHARRFWVVYGNSLGISNESHWLGADLLAQPRALAKLLATMLRLEVVKVFGVFGVALALVGAARAWRRGRVAIYWLGAVYVFYLVALRTTGHNWAFYYHALGAAPVCLLLGQACTPRAVLMGRGRERAEGSSRLKAQGSRLNAQGSTVMRLWRARTVQFAALLCLGVFGVITMREVDLFPPRSGDAWLYPRYTAAQALAPRIGEKDLIVTVGGPKFDETGRPVAYDDGSLLFFLDRKGFVIPREEASVETLRRLAGRGARFLVERRASPLAAQARDAFKSAGTFGEYELFELSPGGRSHPGLGERADRLATPPGRSQINVE